MSKKFKVLLRKNVNIFEKITGFKIKQSSLLLKRLMLKTLDMLNSYYHNDNVDYEFILNKNKMKELNEKIKTETLLSQKHYGEDNLIFIKLRKDIDLILKYDNFLDEFFKESKELYSSFTNDTIKQDQLQKNSQIQKKPLKILEIKRLKIL